MIVLNDAVPGLLGSGKMTFATKTLKPYTRLGKRPVNHHK